MCKLWGTSNEGWGYSTTPQSPTYNEEEEKGVDDKLNSVNLLTHNKPYPRKGIFADNRLSLPLSFSL